ncbi:DUF2529 family protein [Fictibacillus sp. Mic-4]|uniref:DUF2529 family protein n=1 Tax=Fictibacillus sp. Mic-4 TaxID=3132826 RepID=UPI003CE7F97C
MLKIFSTQLVGLMNKIQKDEEAIEDAARLLAQTVLSEGAIYFSGTNEMKAVCYEGVFGQEAFSSSRLLELEKFNELTSIDTVIVASRFNDDLEMIKQLAAIKKETPARVIAISAVKKETGEAQDLRTLADFHLDTQLARELVPLEDGSRTGFPSALMALYVYHALALTTKDILLEFEE